MAVAMGTSALQNMTGGTGERDIYGTAILLFTHRHSADMHERQVATIRRLCKMYREGFYVADLRNLCKLLEILGSMISEGKQEFVEPLVEMLRICSIPFVKEIASEEYRNFSALCDTIEMLAKLLLCSDKRVVLAAGEVLATYASSEEGLPATISYHHQVLEHSKIAACLGTAFREGGGADRQVLVQLLRVVLELSRTKELAVQLLEQGCLPAVVESLLCGFKTEIVLFSVEALWNVFELVPPAVARIANARTIDVLRQLLTDLLTEGHRTQDKELRNEVLVLLTYLAECDACREEFANSGLLETLLTTSSAVEADAPRSSVKAFVLTSCAEDFEMKRAMINIICHLLVDDTSMSQIAAHPVFLGALLLHLDRRLEQHVARCKYSRQQARQLQVQCLEALALTVPRCPDLFRDMEGVPIVLEFLAEQSEESLRASTLLLLQNTASLPGFQEEMGGRVCAMMLSLIKERGLHPFPIRQAAISVLSRLCHGCPANQQAVGELQGVEVLVENVEWSIDDATRTEPICLTAVDAVWNIVCGNSQNEVLLARAHGMHALLHLLDECPPNVKYLVTSCLANLLENKALLKNVYTWRSRHSRRGVVPLLLSLWDQAARRAEEEDSLHMEVHNERRMREEEMESWQGFERRMREEETESWQLVEYVVHQNLFTKIHALLSCLAFEVGDDMLSTEEEKKLRIIAHYVNEKDAILWRTFSRELGEEGIRPVTPDHRVLETRFRADGDGDEVLQERLLECDEEHDNRQHADLELFYQRIYEEKAAKSSTQRRLANNMPTSTRTKIIVDSHKAQVYPPLLNPKQDSIRDQEAKKRRESGGNSSLSQARGTPQAMKGEGGGGKGGWGVDAFLNDAATTRMVNSRPGSGRSGSGGGKGSLPAGGGMAAAAALRAS